MTKQCFQTNSPLKIVNSKSGAVHWVDKSNFNFSFFLVLRDKSVETISKKSGTFRALNHLQAVVKTTEQSAGKKGKSSTGSKYSIFWDKPKRTGCEFFSDKVQNFYLDSANILKKMRLEWNFCNNVFILPFN